MMRDLWHRKEASPHGCKDRDGLSCQSNFRLRGQADREYDILRHNVSRSSKDVLKIQDEGFIKLDATYKMGQGLHRGGRKY